MTKREPKEQEGVDSSHLLGQPKCLSMSVDWESAGQALILENIVVI